MDVPSGYVVGDWTVGRRIGAGQHGTVYAAVRSADESTLSDAGAEDPPRRAAIKITRELTDAGREGLRHCMDQDRALRERGRSPWAIRICEIVELRDDHLRHLDGASAVVMELAGCSLEELIGRAEVNVERLLLDTVRAVAGMHEFVAGRGAVFHGDLKPSNILVLDDGAVRIGDLDLVQATEGTHLDAAERPGTRDYLPPEMFAGEPLVRRTHDIWAVGVIAHRVLSGGAHPFPLVDGSRAAAVTAYAAGERPLQLDANLARFPAVWATAIRRCLQPDRAERAAVDLGRLADEVAQGSPGGRRAPTRLARRPTLPTPTVEPEAPVAPVRPRPTTGRPGWLALVLAGVVAAAVASAATAALARPADPAPAVDARELGRVQSNAGFGGADLCSRYRTVGPLTVKSCIHHTANGYYGGLVVHSSSDVGQRVDAEWDDVRAVPGGDPRPVARSHQSVVLDPDDTITLLTTPRSERVDGCLANTGYLLADRTTVVRSPFKDDAAACAGPAGWPLAERDDPPPARAAAAVPGGFGPADCAGAWSPGPPASGIQFRACLYHRADNPNLWNPGVEVRNIVSGSSPPLALQVRLVAARRGEQGRSTVAEQALPVEALPTAATRSVAAAFRRWPSGEDDVCLGVEAWADGTDARTAIASPYRDRQGRSCDV